jgi:hypothetical protein
MSKKVYMTTYLNVNETHEKLSFACTIAEERHLVRGD